MRMIDADALAEAMGVKRLMIQSWKADSAWGVPIVDAEPVVRCKDCKYYVLARDGEACAMVCECSAVYGDGYGWAPQPDDYCSRGERKGGDEGNV